MNTETLNAIKPKEQSEQNRFDENGKKYEYVDHV